MNRDFEEILREASIDDAMALGKEVIQKMRDAYPEGSFYFIGGTARDYLAGNECNDVDIATDLEKNEIMTVFPDVVSANRFGAGYIVIINYKGQKFDIDSVVDHPIREKIATGDLTINCMAVDPTTEEVIDPDNGQGDLSLKRLRFSTYVFDLLKRGAEARSVLRPFKFQARWGWDFDGETVDAMKKFVDDGYNFNRVQPNNMQKIVDQIKSGKHAKKAWGNIEEFGLLELLKQYDAKKGTKLAESKKVREFDEEKWKNFRDRSEDNLTKDHLGKGLNRKGLGGYFSHEADEIIDKIRKGELDPDEMERDELVMSAMRRAGKTQKGNDSRIDLRKKNFIQRMFDASIVDAPRMRETQSISSDAAYKIGAEMCEAIKKFGNFCYFVGGAARDHILGKTPNDVDLITDMSEKFLQEKMGSLVKNKFWRNGSQVLVLEKDGEEFEVKRLPRSMSLEQELSARDLTMNSIAWDPTTDEYIDPTDGRGDLERGVLEFTPFTLDAVADGKQPARVIRAFRFMSTTGFDFGEKTKDSLRQFAEKSNGLFGLNSDVTQENNWGKFRKGKFMKKAQDAMRELGFEPELEAQFG